MKTFEQNYDAQSKLIYSLIVAGKSADFADRACRAFLISMASQAGDDWSKTMPLDVAKKLNGEQIEQCARAARTGNYRKIARAVTEISALLTGLKLDLWTCGPADLERVHGIGRKTSRFFIMWIRPTEQYAALDVHILRWLRQNGHPDAPRATPASQKVYERLEAAFIALATAQGKTARQLDEEIWIAGAGRTQKTALP